MWSRRSNDCCTSSSPQAAKHGLWLAPHNGSWRHRGAQAPRPPSYAPWCCQRPLIVGAPDGRDAASGHRQRGLADARVRRRPDRLPGVRPSISLRTPASSVSLARYRPACGAMGGCDLRVLRGLAVPIAGRCPWASRSGDVAGSLVFGAYVDSPAGWACVVGLWRGRGGSRRADGPAELGGRPGRSSWLHCWWGAGRARAAAAGLPVGVRVVSVAGRSPVAGVCGGSDRCSGGCVGGAAARVTTSSSFRVVPSGRVRVGRG